jgi:uncharacterized membrane protein YphA (DoxX/SURF4 family)
MASSSKALLALRIALQVILGAVFIYAAWVKLSNPWQLFASDIDNYHILPPFRADALTMVELVARTLPWLEGALGLALIVGVWPRIFASISAAILLTFFTLMVWAMATGKKIDCGCFGPGEQISALTLARDGSLVAAALALAWMAFRRRRSLA